SGGQQPERSRCTAFRAGMLAGLVGCKLLWEVGFIGELPTMSLGQGQRVEPLASRYRSRGGVEQVDLQLTGKNVLVTGAGQGVGHRIAEAFVAEGANVAFSYNTSGQGAEEAAAAARADGVKAVAIQADISRGDDVTRLVSTTKAELGSVDILINNAAYTEPGGFLDLDADALVRMVEVTVVGTFRVTQAVVREMVDNGGGSIVSLMGDSGRVGESKLSAVATSRSSTMGLMKSVAKEFGRHNVRANTVSLGLVQSEKFDHHTGHADDERMARIVKMYPLRRVGQTSDIPPMVLLLASPLSGWTTGQTVSVNGGYSMV
ncbi:MAG: SDR family NAD(P)-dependent oxidoreductase, partial [Acidimicrobiales bacterium]